MSPLPTPLTCLQVRQAIFNMIQSQAGSSGGLPPGTRWLDMFAGTGSVGLEALSRGCAEAHFIELDPWVCKKVREAGVGGCCGKLAWHAGKEALAVRAHGLGGLLVCSDAVFLVSKEGHCGVKLAWADPCRMC